jgi:hypothetical protein
MKRLILFIIAVFTVVFVEAQVATAKILIPNTYATITSPTATASIYKITSTTAGYVLFQAPMNNGSKQDYVIKLDSVSGNHTNVAVAVYGQKSTIKGDWTQIGSTVNWKGTTADTTIVISNATANRYRDYKVTYTLTGTGSVAGIKNQEFKLYLE